MQKNKPSSQKGFLQKNLHYFLLFFIIFFAGYIRFHDLTSVPPSLNWDEAATGYNAYSILKTGKDEFGKTFPLYFRSYDDFKQPIYMYMTVGSIKLLGYNDFAIRFPSAFFGVCTILVFYLLVKHLTQKEYLSLLSAEILAILPWHVSFSHYAIEANVGLFFFLSGVLYVVYSLTKNRWFLPFAIFLFGIASYTYQSYRIIIPLFGLLIAGLYPKQLFKRDLSLYLSCGIILLLALFLIYELKFIGINNRFSQTTVINDYATFKHQSNEILYDGTQGINLPRRVFHEIPILISSGLVIRGYLTHFNPDFLFFDLEQRLHFAPDVGYLYLWMLPFILFGIYQLIRSKEKKLLLFFLGMLLIIPIPASVTWDVPQGIRTLSMVIPFSFFAAYGLYEFLLIVKRFSIYLSFVFGTVITLCILFSLQFFMHQYFVHFPKERSQLFQYGEKQMTEYLQENKNKYKRIIISTNIDRAYLFMLYYSKYDPAKLLKENPSVSGSYNYQKNHFDKYEFHVFDFKKNVQQNTLFVGLPTDFPNTIKPIYTISNLDGSPALYFVTEKQIQTHIDKCVAMNNQNCYNLKTLQTL